MHTENCVQLNYYYILNHIHYTTHTVPCPHHNTQTSQCTLYTEYYPQHNRHITHCTMYSVPFRILTHYTLHTMHYTIHTLHIKQCIYNIHCTLHKLHTINCRQDTVHYTLSQNTQDNDSLWLQR